MLKSQDSAKLFMDIVFIRAYQQLIDDIEAIRLPEGFGEWADDPARSSEWYLSLDDEEKKFVNEIAKLSVAESVFRFLAILDGNIGYPIQGKISDFAVYLQTYRSLEDKSKNLPEEKIRLNGSSVNLDDLHDAFYARLTEGQE